jgi:hypothetical protein
VPSSAVMMGRWMRIGCAAKASSHRPRCNLLLSRGAACPPSRSPARPMLDGWLRWPINRLGVPNRTGGSRSPPCGARSAGSPRTRNGGGRRGSVLRNDRAIIRRHEPRR